MTYGMVKDEKRGMDYLVDSLGKSPKEIQELSDEERTLTLCRAFRADSNRYMGKLYAAWTAAWIGFGVHTALYDSNDMQKYAASALGTAWGLTEVVMRRREQLRMNSQIDQTLPSSVSPRQA